MPSTRSLRARSQSQSQSQSQSSSLGTTKDKAPNEQKHDQTFESLSTAILPPAYAIRLATTTDDGTISAERKVQEHVRGQEFLSDGIRRLGEREGILGNLVASKSRKRRRLNSAGGKEKGSVGVDEDALWYTASLRHACSCKSVKDGGTGTAQLIC